VIKMADIEAFCTGQAGAGAGGAGGAGCNATQLLQMLRLTPDGASQVVFVQGLADGAYSLTDFPDVAGSSAPAAGSGTSGGNGAQPRRPSTCHLFQLPPCTWHRHTTHPGQCVSQRDLAGRCQTTHSSSAANLGPTKR